MKAKALKTAKKQRRLTGTREIWRRLGKKSDEKCRNHCTTESNKSTHIIFDFCVVFAGQDMVIDTRRATAGKCKFKISPMQKGIFIKKVISKNHPEVLDKHWQKLTHGKLKPTRRKWTLSQQQVNKDDWPNEKMVEDLRKIPIQIVEKFAKQNLRIQHFAVSIFCVDLVVDDMGIDNRKPAAGSCKSKPSSILKVDLQQTDFLKKGVRNYWKNKDNKLHLAIANNPNEINWFGNSSQTKTIERDEKKLRRTCKKNLMKNVGTIAQLNLRSQPTSFSFLVHLWWPRHGHWHWQGYRRQMQFQTFTNANRDLHKKSYI